MNPKNLIPKAIKSPLRSLIEYGSDRILNSSLPPARLRSHISPLWLDFRKTGRDQLEFLIEMTGLRKTDAILDIGCGVGRLALPLTGYLSESGSYRGFDVFAECIDWCQQKISSRFKNFEFQCASISTPWSMGDGLTADHFVFPYEDASFDLAYAGSLFTHLTAAAAQNYLRQTHRVLRPGAKFVSTWLLYNSKSINLWRPLSIDSLWPRTLENCRAIGSGPPEGSVLFDEIDTRKWFQDVGFRILDPLRPDATYNPAHKPNGDRTVGMNLYYSCCVTAVKL
jgi:SAM-dependent methyltransferase